MKRLIKIALLSVSLCVMAVIIFPLITEETYADEKSIASADEYYEVDEGYGDSESYSKGSNQGGFSDDTYVDVEYVDVNYGGSKSSGKEHNSGYQKNYDAYYQDNQYQESNENAEIIEDAQAEAMARKEAEEKAKEKAREEAEDFLMMSPVATFGNDIEQSSGRLGEPVDIKLRNRTNTDCIVRLEFQDKDGYKKLFDDVYLSQVGNEQSSKRLSLYLNERLFAEGVYYIRIMFDYGSSQYNVNLLLNILKAKALALERVTTGKASIGASGLAGKYNSPENKLLTASAGAEIVKAVKVAKTVRNAAAATGAKIIKKEAANAVNALNTINANINSVIIAAFIIIIAFCAVIIFRRKQATNC